MVTNQLPVYYFLKSQAKVLHHADYFAKSQTLSLLYKQMQTAVVAATTACGWSTQLPKKKYLQ